MNEYRLLTDDAGEVVSLDKVTRVPIGERGAHIYTVGPCLGPCPSPEPDAMPGPDPTAEPAPAPGPAPTVPLEADSRPEHVQMFGEPVNGAKVILVGINKTLEEALEESRPGSPDRILLKRGSTWVNQGFGDVARWGASVSERFVISRYGDESLPPPLVLVGDAQHAFAHYRSGSLESMSIDHVILHGIDFEAHQRNPDNSTFNADATASGIELLGGLRDFQLIDCTLSYFTNNVSIHNYAKASGKKTDAKIEDISFTDCRLIGAWNKNGHSQGIYISDADGVLINHNIFDHNGWLEGVAKGTIFNHGVYMQNSNTERTAFSHNVVLRSASHGIQLRSGGECNDNLFIQNPIALLLGAGSTPTPGGVIAQCNDNGIFWGNDIEYDVKVDGPGPRGWAIDAGLRKTATPLRPGSEIKRNLIAHVRSAGSGVSSIIPVPNTTYQGNLTYKWGAGTTAANPAWPSPEVQPGDLAPTGGIINALVEGRIEREEVLSYMRSGFGL